MLFGAWIIVKAIFCAKWARSQSVYQFIYLNECIKKKRLVPFIKEHHFNDQYLFWPDLASSHYAKTVVTYFKEQKINFVEKEDNPPNVPECRPIEDFWSIFGVF